MHGLEPELLDYLAMLRTILAIALVGALLSLGGLLFMSIAPEMYRSISPTWTVYGIVFGLAFIIASIAFS